ncbi:cytosolic phospholipase A2-like isoform X2 [Mytilus edulis]|uniref:cytosolic phospholipase A2-like isoform X2 n=1 Tax=Mytilus edulis TaxID=6550 RepID=UPI0039EE7E6E
MNSMGVSPRVKDITDAIPFPFYWKGWKPQSSPVRKVPSYSVNNRKEEPVLSPRSKEKKMSFSRVFDPYQVFEVEHRPCLILTVKVVRGKNITHGWYDYVDTPDPYIILNVKTSPEGRRRTETKDNEVNPVWNEEFTFLIDDRETNKLQMILMEANYGNLDQVIGEVYFDLKELPLKTRVNKIFSFNEKSEVEFEFETHFDENPTLRYSLCLCDEEKEFIEHRTEKVMKTMKDLLGDKAPETREETPRIAVIGSGGGFRAMVGMSGVLKALADSKILDCVTFLGGLSGSSWYISTLYSHQDWPTMNPGAMQEELKNNIDSSLLWLLTPLSIKRYIDRILVKRQNGQPVSFTDIFGHLVGETLVKDRLHTKLTDLQDKIAGGAAPMPLMTCVNVKADRSARSFHEWVEFNPFEIGMPKYGTFMKTELFGSKFFMGKLCTEYEEQPLHFLQGIWGSAFCILFKRLLDDNKKLDPVEMIRQEMVKQIEQSREDESSDSSDESDETEVEEKPRSSRQFTFDVPQTNGAKENGQAPKRQTTKRRTKQKGYWNNFLSNILENKRFEVLNTRAGRAGVVHNFMRGLSLTKTFPLSPFTPDTANKDTDDFDGIHELHPTNVKHLYMVDAGLTFNSPFPLVLRPQRAVDIILSFDFSARPGDQSPPFKEILLAEKWARLNKLPFPPIDVTVFDREGMKELYIFKHPTDPHCPVVLHFVLVNIDFREFTKPGVRRTAKEKEFADFDIFDDPATPYSTFNFKYTHDAFEKLSKLTEFNTLSNIDAIKTAMLNTIEKKRTTPPKIPIQLNEVSRLRRVSKKNKAKLSRYLSRLSSCRDSRTSVTIEEEEENDENGHRKISKTLSDAPIICKKPGLERKMAVSERKRRTNKSIGGLGGLSSPREEDESDELDSSNASVKLRTIGGRKRKDGTFHDAHDHWSMNRCNSIQSDEEDDQFYSMASS